MTKNINEGILLLIVLLIAIGIGVSLSIVPANAGLDTPRAPGQRALAVSGLPDVQSAGLSSALSESLVSLNVNALDNELSVNGLSTHFELAGGGFKKVVALKVLYDRLGALEVAA